MWGLRSAVVWLCEGCGGWLLLVRHRYVLEVDTDSFDFDGDVAQEVRGAVDRDVKAHHVDGRAERVGPVFNVFIWESWTLYVRVRYRDGCFSDRDVFVDDADRVFSAASRPCRGHAGRDHERGEYGGEQFG